MGTMDILMSDRGLKEGDVIVWNQKNKTIYFFEPGGIRIVFQKWGDKTLVGDMTLIEFIGWAEIIAETHQLTIKKYEMTAVSGNKAFQFVKK